MQIDEAPAAGIRDARLDPVEAWRAERPMEPSERTLQLIAADGYVLGATLFEPAPGGEPIRGVIVMHGAVAVPQSFYRKLARYLASAGFGVLTYDFRGIGRSRPPSLRGFSASLVTWAKLDAKAALAHATELAAGKPVIAIGHSFGGQLIGLLDEMREVACVVMVASQLPHVGMYPPVTRARYHVLLNGVMPLVSTVLGYLPGSLGLGADLPKGVVLEWVRWLTSPGYLTAHVPDARARFARFARPVLQLSFTDDELAPAQSIEALAAALTGAQVTARRIAPAQIGLRAIGHHGFFRSQLAPTLWQQARAFIDQAIGERPAAS